MNMNMLTKCFKFKKKKKKKTSCCCESAEKVASSDDMITEILLDLPVSSLFRFKSVSKHWLSIITSPHFSRLHIHRRGPLGPSGLFIPIDETRPQYRYIPLDGTGPFQTVTFPTSCDPVGIRILQSCNGLLFCSTSDFSICKFYVYNPTTRQFTVIPLPQLFTGWDGNSMLTYSTTLAFDPSTSPHYKLVCVHCLGVKRFQILVYSSQTQLWNVCGDYQLASTDIFNTNYWNGVYLNGAVHWMTKSRTAIYFKIDDEKLIETMSMPPISDNSIYIYFGQSGGRLHLITTVYGPVLNVYEMEKDCSKWWMRYQVDLSRRELYHEIIIMGIVIGEKEEDSLLVFKTKMNGFIRFMKYKFVDKTLKMLFEIVDMGDRGAPEYRHISTMRIFCRTKAFEFIQSLSHV